MTAGAPDARSMAAAAAAAAVVREAAAAAVFDHLEGESGQWFAPAIVFWFVSISVPGAGRRYCAAAGRR